MKIIIDKDLFLERLREKDLELIRKWRNAPEISQFMEYRDFITPEMQKKWFESINNYNNLYLLISYKGNKIGIANGKKVYWNKRTVEGGIFLWDKTYRETEVPALVFLVLGELTLNILKLESYGRILKSNKTAKRFNKSLGYELCDGQEEEENQLYKLNKESFLEKNDILRKAFLKKEGQHPVTIIFEEHDKADGFAEFFESQFDPETIDNIKETEEGRVITFKPL